MAASASHARRWLAAGAAALLVALAVLGYRTLTAPVVPVAPIGAAGSQQTLRSGAELVQSHYCLRCHGMARVGPDFSQIAQRYRNDPAAPAQLAERIQRGSAGRWGRKLMPRQPGIGAEEAQALAAWVLAQPDPGQP